MSKIGKGRYRELLLERMSKIGKNSKKSKLGKGRYHVMIKLGVGKGQRTTKRMKQRNIKGLKFK